MSPGGTQYSKLVDDFCRRCDGGEHWADVLCGLASVFMFRRAAHIVGVLLRGEVRRLPAGAITAPGKPTRKVRR